MSQFRTTFDIPPSKWKIDYSKPIFSIGSCFAEHIAERLAHHCFKVHSNPNGILFNPVSLADNIQSLIHRTPYNEEDFIQQNGLWHSWHHHGSCSAADPDEMVNNLNTAATHAADHLAQSKVLLVTFGTSFAYRYRATNKIVANCHKVPNHEFDKIRLGEHHIVGVWQDTIELLQQTNPDLQVIMTVSPIRHMKDGIVANQRSKAQLLLAIEALCQQFPNVHYFPSYELMMDDLRDYRFYKSDMLHPTDQAIDYIWDRFVEAFVSGDAQSQMKEVHKLQLARAHRPLFPDSAEAIAFHEKTEKEWKVMMGRLF